MTPYKNSIILIIFILLATSLVLSSCGGGSDKPKKPQTISFANNQPVLVEGSTFVDDVIASGTGKVLYSSSNPSIATVNDAGEVTAISSGMVTITATIASDRTYNQASVSHIIKIVSKPIEMSLWIGSDKLQIDLPEEALGSYLYRSSDINCDLNKIYQCESGEVYLITDLSFEDAISLTDVGVYYSLEKSDGQKATIELTEESDNGIEYAISPVEFNNKLWLISSERNPDNSFFNAMKYSENGGRSWQTINKQLETLPIQRTSLESFNNKLWIYGGSTNPLNDYYDIWSSSDGVMWQLEFDGGATSHGSNWYTQYNNKFWRIGEWVKGMTGSMFATNTISNTSDGVLWETVGIDLPSFIQSADLYPKAVTHNGKLWLLFVDRNSQQLWHSQNGTEWALSSTIDENHSFTSYNEEILSFNDKIWIFSITNDDQVIASSSSDGIDWDITTTNLTQSFHIMNFNNGLLAFTKGAVWFSTDGIQWNKGFSATFDFSQP